VHHPVIIVAVRLVRAQAMLWCVHLHMAHVRRLSWAHIWPALLEVEGKLMLVSHVRHHVWRVRCCHCRAREGLAFKVLLVGQAHGRVGLFIILDLPPGRQSIIRRPEATVLLPVTPWRGSNLLNVTQDMALLGVDSLGLAADELPASRRGRPCSRHGDIISSGPRAGASARLAGGTEGRGEWSRPELMAGRVQLWTRMGGYAAKTSVDAGIDAAGGSRRRRATLRAGDVLVTRGRLRELLLLDITESLRESTSRLLGWSATIVPILPVWLLRVLLPVSRVPARCTTLWGYLRPIRSSRHPSVGRILCCALLSGL